MSETTPPREVGNQIMRLANTLLFLIEAQKTALAAAQEELAAVRRVEAWLRAHYTRRVVAYDALPDALLHLVSRGECLHEADSLAALGRLLKEGENG